MPPAKQKKFYGVRGSKPGVYESWDECQKAIAGVSGATHKSFLSHEEATAWVNGCSAASRSAPTRYYAVARGHNPGVYTDWDSAQKQTIGFTKPMLRKFDTHAEADDFLSANQGAEVQEILPPTKKLKKAHRLDNGAVPGNGKAIGGIGVWFGDNDPRNISERLAGPVQTSQRAELTAIVRALQALDVDSPIEIRTDSQYAIDCVTKWCDVWIKNGWKTTEHMPVKNADLIKAIRALIDQRDEKGTITIFTKVDGHSGDYGNDEADRLAILGAQLPAVEEANQP
ncbi:ribonuclease H-like domain-containing protein [Apiosordaria backusii]|uniref:Ribonuclease H n=1 Tax=Apiosordaria backusii TaxID=314023 RepID=A0AA40DID0_9PEZI|nr:ribonuclease H-like domain-containing protein [Apiosordaria backusii]